jgi:hypothetical protein
LYHEINTQAGRKFRGNVITKPELVQALKVAGMIPEFDGMKIVAMIESDNRVDHNQFS